MSETAASADLGTLTAAEGSRSRRSALSTLSALALAVIAGGVQFLVMRLVLGRYGSDFNGVNATAQRFVDVLLLLEGGITLASNVALFSPLLARDVAAINGVLAATHRLFRRLGWVTLAVGVPAALVLAAFVRSDLPYWVVAATLVLAALSTAFTLGVTSKYTVLAQSQQREYVLNVIRIVTTVLAQLLVVVAISLGAHMLWVRALTALGIVANGLVIAWWVRRSDPWLDFRATPTREAIVGTRDVLAQKLTGAVYSAAPTLVIAMAVSAVAASVYAVYDLVATFLKSLLYAFANGPRMGVGQVAAEGDAGRTKRVFLEYEALVTQATLVVGATAAALYVPFARLYKPGDPLYVDPLLAALVSALLVLELAHIPAGHLINLTGRFRVARNFQWAALALLVPGLALGAWLAGLHGIVLAVAAAAVLLCVLEIGYVHTRLLPAAGVDYLRLGIAPALVFGGLGVVEMRLLEGLAGWPALILAGLGLVAANGLVSVVVGWVAHRDAYAGAWRRLLGMVRARVSRG